MAKTAHPDDKQKLIINEETAPIVRRMFEMCVAGMGARSIATTLNNEGVLSPRNTPVFVSTTRILTVNLFVRVSGHGPMCSSCSKTKSMWGAWCRGDNTPLPTAVKSGNRFPRKTGLSFRICTSLSFPANCLTQRRQS